MMQSLVLKGEQGGYLPIFPAWNSYTSEMIGDHTGVVITDGYMKGLRNFDVAGAWKLIRQNAFDTPPFEQYKDGLGRRALAVLHEVRLHSARRPCRRGLPSW